MNRCVRTLSFTIIAALCLRLPAVAADAYDLVSVDDPDHATRYGKILKDGRFQECKKLTASALPAGSVVRPLKGRHCDPNPDDPSHLWSLADGIDSKALLTSGSATGAAASFDGAALGAYLKTSAGQELVRAAKANDTAKIKQLQRRGDFKSLVVPQ